MAKRYSVKETNRYPFALTATVMAAVIIAFLYWARAVVIPLTLAIVFTFILSPGVTRLRRYGLGRLPATILVAGLATIVVAAIGFFVTWQMTSFVQELPNHSERIKEKLDVAAGWFGGSGGRLPGLFKEVEQALGGKNDKIALPVVIASDGVGWRASISSYLFPAVDLLAMGALTALLSFFMLLGREDMRNRVLRLIGPRRLTASTRAVDDAGARISRYLRMQLLINVSFGIILAVILLVLQVPYPLLWGFIAAVMRYVPYIGAWIGLIPPVLASVSMSDIVWQPMAVLVAYAALELLVNSFAEPRLFGQSLGISEVAQVASAAFWAFLWGPIGLILSGPMTACLLVLGKNVPQLKALDIILGHDEALPPHMAFFQRLAARDRDEAWRTASQFVRNHSSDELADGLLLPALHLAETAVDRRELLEEDGVWIVETMREIADDVTETKIVGETQSDGKAERTRILMVPAADPGDELALELLAQRLPTDTWEIRQLSTDSLASDMLTAVREERPAVVIVASLAAGDLAHTRYLCKRLRGAANSSIKLLVGRWGQGDVPQHVRAELGNVGVDGVTANIAAMQKLLQSSHSVLTAASEPKPEAPRNSSEKPRVGTASASLNQ